MAASNSAYIASLTTAATGFTNFNTGATSFSTNLYTNYSGTYSVSQYKGSSVTLTGTISAAAISGGAGIAVFVDWNQDGLFTGTGELVYTTTSWAYAFPSVTITVPANAVTGNTRMRVMLDYNTQNMTARYCSAPASSDGETEDSTQG